MNKWYAVIVIVLLVLPTLYAQVHAKPSKASSSQSTSYFDSFYHAFNYSLQHYDIQHVDLNQKEYLYVSFVQNNSTYYNTFSFTELHSKKELVQNDFQKLQLSPTLINDSTAVEMSQFYSIGNINIFVVYFVFSSESKCYFLFVNKTTNDLLARKLIDNPAFAKKNTFIEFPNSKDLYFEMQTWHYVIMLKIDTTTFSVSQVYQNRYTTNVNQVFGVRDTEFINNEFYMVVDYTYLVPQPGLTHDTNNCTIYVFSFSDNTLKMDQINYNGDIESIAIQGSTIYAYSLSKYHLLWIDQTTRRVLTTFDFSNFSTQFSFIRLLTNNQIVLGDRFDNLFFFYLKNNGNYYSYEYNKTYIPLQGSSEINLEYTFETQNDNNTINYFIAGYLKDGYKNIGFGMIYQNLNTKPDLFLNVNKPQSMALGPITTTTQQENNAISLLFLVMLIILIPTAIVLILGILRYRKEKTLLNREPVRAMNGTRFQSRNLCPSCGSLIRLDDSYCEQCGYKV